MRIAVFSDTHGNCLALDTTLGDMEKFAPDAIVCLGDAVQGGPQPAEIVARIRDLGVPTVMGNSDAWLISGEETDAELIPEERRKKLDLGRAWSTNNLSEEDRAFIGTFQPTVSIPLGDGRSLLCFHGSPTSFNQVILPTTPEDEFQGLLRPYADRILTGGHVHLQFSRRLRESQNFFFNPGSVGVAYNHEQADDRGMLDPWAEYAILTVNRMEVSLDFRRIPLDMDRMAEVYRKSDLPFADVSMERYLRYS